MFVQRDINNNTVTIKQSLEQDRRAIESAVTFDQAKYIFKSIAFWKIYGSDKKWNT